MSGVQVPYCPQMAKVSKTKQIVLTENQWQRISELLGNLGLLTLASLVIPYITDKPNSLNVVAGLVMTTGLWYASIVTARKY